MKNKTVISSISFLGMVLALNFHSPIGTAINSRQETSSSSNNLLSDGDTSGPVVITVTSSPPVDTQPSPTVTTTAGEQGF